MFHLFVPLIFGKFSKILRKYTIRLCVRGRRIQNSLRADIRILALIAFGWGDVDKVMLGRENGVLLLFAPSKISLSAEFLGGYWGFDWKIF